MNITLIVLGIYLLAVARAGNGKQLITDAEADKEFMVWVIAVAVLYGISRIPDASGIANGLIAIALLALLINSIGTVKSQWSALFDQIMSAPASSPTTGS